MTISDFKLKTEKKFHCINGKTADNIEQIIKTYISEQLDELKINNVILTGNRYRGKEQNKSDIDVILYYNGNEREDSLFNILHDTDIRIDNITVDINPISSKLTDIEQYLDDIESYLENKR